MEYKEFKKVVIGFLVFALWGLGLILFFSGYITSVWKNAVGGLFMIIVGLFVNDLAMKRFGTGGSKDAKVCCNNTDSIKEDTY